MGLNSVEVFKFVVYGVWLCFRLFWLEISYGIHYGASFEDCNHSRQVTSRGYGTLTSLIRFMSNIDFNFRVTGLYMNVSVNWLKALTNDWLIMTVCIPATRIFMTTFFFCHLPNYLIHGFPMESGPRLNIKTVLSTYGDFHVKDKTAVRTSYL